MLSMFLLLSPAIVILSRLDRFDVNDDLLLMVWNVSSSIDFHFAGEICSLLQHIFPIAKLKNTKVMKINSIVKGARKRKGFARRHVHSEKNLRPSKLTFVGVFQSIEGARRHDSMRKARRSFHTFPQRWLRVLMDNRASSAIRQDEVNPRFQIALVRLINLDVRNFLDVSTYRESHRLPTISALN